MMSMMNPRNKSRNSMRWDFAVSVVGGSGAESRSLLASSSGAVADEDMGGFGIL